MNKTVVGDPVARRLLAVQALSELGDFIGLAALMLLTFEGTGSVIGPAAVFAARSLPSILVGTALSGWLDRPSRRAALVTLALVGAVVVGTVAVSPTVVVALVAAAVLGGSRTAYLSVATGAVVDAVHTDLRGRFYALSSAINQGAQVTGFLCGTTATLWVGPRVALGFDALTFVVAAVVLRTLPYIAPHRRDERPRSTDGIRTIAGIPALCLIAPAVWASSIGSALPETLAPQIASRADLPFVMAAAPFGMMAAAMTIGRTDLLRDLRRQLMVACALGGVFAVGALVLALGTFGWLLIAINMAVGAGSVWIVGARTTFATHTPPERMAQVEATMVASITLIEGAGVLVISAAVTLFGPWVGYGLAAIPLVLTTLLALARSAAPDELGAGLLTGRRVLERAA